MDWAAVVFGTTDQVSWAQECARAVLIFAYGLVLVRIMGRRLFGKWAALDIVVSIIIGSNLSRALTGAADLFGTLLATTLLVALHWLLAQGAARVRRLSRLLEGAPVGLAQDGRTDERTRRRCGISEADLHQALREAGVEEVAATRRVVLEPSGKINVLK